MFPIATLQQYSIARGETDSVGRVSGRLSPVNAGSAIFLRLEGRHVATTTTINLHYILRYAYTACGTGSYRLLYHVLGQLYMKCGTSYIQMYIHTYICMFCRTSPVRRGSTHLPWPTTPRHRGHLGPHAHLGTTCYEEEKRD